MKDTFLEYATRLEESLAARSDELEDLHLEAAIDAQLIDTSQQAHQNSLQVPSTAEEGELGSKPMFADYTNPNAVANCLSPYVPTKADQIAAFLRFAGLNDSDLLLDPGCGDGRVCIAASKLTGCQAIGLDVSPACIRLARQIAVEEGTEASCDFVQADATVDPSQLLSDGSPLEGLWNVTCVFLYTYPTLLQALVPLLEHLSRRNRIFRVVTLTYHLDDMNGVPIANNEVYDFRLYSEVKRTES